MDLRGCNKESVIEPRRILRGPQIRSLRRPIRTPESLNSIKEFCLEFQGLGIRFNCPNCLDKIFNSPLVKYLPKFTSCFGPLARIMVGKAGIPTDGGVEIRYRKSLKIFARFLSCPIHLDQIGTEVEESGCFSLTGMSIPCGV